MGFPFNYPNYGFSPTYLPQNFPSSPPVSPQTAQGSVTSPSGFSCRPVTSKAQAEVEQIPFDGSTTYFVDTANGKIYSKTFNFNDGTAPLVTYVRETVAPPVQYAPLDAMDALRGEIEALRSEVDSLKKTKKAVKRNDEYDDE